jgi:porphobilinogen synthase
LYVDGKIPNDETVEILCQQALNQAKAGADIVAPSDMMDLRVQEIRKTLDQNNFQNKIILSYAAKFASAFYGPFRDAVGSTDLSAKDKALGFRDKRSYQMNPANSDEALREVELDLNEGADMVMVKPGLPYLDVIYRIKKEFGVPTFAYQVSGEYSSLMAAAQNGWVDKNRIFMESLMSFRRAQADGILTYFAIEAAKILKSQV